MKPKHYKPEYAVAQTVADMQRRFVYPDEDTPAPGLFVGGGGGAPTVVVAASNATALSKAKADFECPGGTGDRIVLQQAVAMMPSGGRLVLTEGDFFLDGTLRLPFAVHMMGMVGASAAAASGASIIFPTASGIGPLIELGNSSRLSDLSLWTTNAFSNVTLVELEGFLTSIHNVGLTASTTVTGTVALVVANESHMITNCVFQARNGTAIRMSRPSSSSAIGVQILGNQFTHGAIESTQPIQECVIANNQMFGIPLDIDGSVTLSLIANNSWFTRITCGGLFSSSINNNVLLGPANVFAIDIGGDNHEGVVADNIVGGGIRWADTFYSQITGNSVGARPDGIVLTPGSFGSEYARIGDNVIEQLTTGGDAIRVEGAATQVNIRDNQIINFGGMAHGINIDDAACNDAVVYANDLGDRSAYTTADFVDNGTNTQTAPGGDGQFGF